MPLDLARTAFARFGFGVHSQTTQADIIAMTKDPQGALLEELAAGAMLDTPFLFSSTDNFKKQSTYQKIIKEKRENTAKPLEQNSTMSSNSQESASPLNKPADVPTDIFRNELKERLKAAFNAKIGITERLVWFFANHFSVSADKSGVIRTSIGSFERETLRPNLLGKFSDLVLAVETHPAMLSYLDNARSVGPNSKVGLREKSGLNENLAREILELHTLGVRSGYSQDDVTALAKTISGWTIPNQKMIEQGQEFSFLFAPNRHEPGAKTIMNIAYPEGEEGGKKVLNWLATHSKTASHLSFLLARHFIADDPPPALVERLTQDFMKSQGNILSLMTTLIKSKEAWEVPPTKLRRPQEWLIAIARGLNLYSEPQRVQNMANILGQPFWRPPSPKGFSDDTSEWLAGLNTRLDIANILARNIKNMGNSPMPLAEHLLGAKMDPETHQALSRAETTQQGLALLFLSTDFMRR